MNTHDNSLKNNTSKFDGERVIEGKTPIRIWLDHVCRYNLACDYAIDKVVLDIACGTGYGSYILRGAGAKKVVGMDTSIETIEFAKNKYQSRELEFKVGNILYIDFPESSFEVITCFETIEHVQNQNKALEELKRVLKPDGLLIISSPNRKLTSPCKSLHEQPDNLFHTIEYTANEFNSVLNDHFKVLNIYGQRGISKLWLLKVVEILTRKLVPSIYDPERGSPELKLMSSFKEYRYITVVCKKLGL